MIILAAGGHWLWNSHRFGVFYVLGQFGLLAFFLGLISIGRRLEARVYLPYLAYAPTRVDPDTTATLPRRQIKAHRRASAALAAAIANGDAQRAHESAESLAAGVGG